ncbi:hypothetical protein Tsubulata_014173 [Turnera subulata]|uniref:Uncharacterized protein n=1 Tax=Turnera subulata TaxID=218843 RepID=A0A9Q0J701_9ROSI|nr:hypothetical protein Tsubulata_014173 [Turnera subulata]
MEASQHRRPLRQTHRGDLSQAQEERRRRFIDSSIDRFGSSNSILGFAGFGLFLSCYRFQSFFCFVFSPFFVFVEFGLISGEELLGSKKIY